MIFVPEAKPRDTKHTVVIIAIRYFNKDHILMARSEVEGIFTYKNHTFYPAKYFKSIEYSFNCPDPHLPALA